MLRYVYKMLNLHYSIPELLYYTPALSGSIFPWWSIFQNCTWAFMYHSTAVVHSTAVGSKLSDHKFSIIFGIILCSSFTDGRKAAFLNSVMS